MLGTKKLRSKLRHSLLQSGVTGEIKAHGARKNLGSIKLLLKQDVYATFGIAMVHEAVKARTITNKSAIAIVAASQGITPERYQQAGPGYIEPSATAAGLDRMMDAIDDAIKSDGLFVVATAHPGSMLAYYQDIIAYIRDKGGRVYETPEPFLIAPYRWIDCVGGVHVLTDEGNLLHTHEAAGFYRFLDQIDETPALVLADHGYAGAAINRAIKTVAIHDVDDPGIPVAAHLGLDVIAIPMNDNQRNVPTVAVIEAVLADRRIK